MRGLTKYFGDFAADSAVDLSVDEGEIHALLGENGAGKSTLVKMMYGILKPDSGDMDLNSEPLLPTVQVMRSVPVLAWCFNTLPFLMR